MFLMYYEIYELAGIAGLFKKELSLVDGVNNLREAIKKGE